MSEDLIKRSDAIKIIWDTHDLSRDWIPLQVTSELIKCIKNLPSADRPQGYWTKVDVATYRCSECGKIQIADDINELNFCCCCGSRNKIRRMKGADDETD